MNLACNTLALQTKFSDKKTSITAGFLAQSFHSNLGEYCNHHPEEQNG